MERHQHAVVKNLSHLGQVWVCDSHKPELLATSLMVFGREPTTFGDETISIASYCFQIFSCVNIEQQECCVNFYDFRVSFGHFYALAEFAMHLCAQFKFELQTHALVHINWLKNQICVLGCMLRSHAWNGNEFQTPGHRWLPVKHWDAWFWNSNKSKTRLKFMKLGILSWSGINMPW